MSFESARGLIPWRPLFWWAGSTIGLLGTFFLVAYVIGWPTSVDRCVEEGTCFCEAFDLDQVKAGATGIRQKVNTLSNFYAVLTSLFVAVMMVCDRYGAGSKNVMKSTWWVTELWVFAVLFLGLGSMWFHASISSAVSWLDSMSMFVFATFLVFYTLDRGFAKRAVASKTRDLVFAIGYPLTVLVCTVLQIAGVDSFVLIFTLVLAYVLMEFLYAGFIFDTWAMCYWLIGVFAMENAILFWALSNDGGPLCDPDSWFQPHGLLWHPLAGVMAVMIYLYWRREYADSDLKEPFKSDLNKTRKDDSGWA